MYDRLEEVRRQHEAKKKIDFFGATLHPRDIDWLIEQAEKAKEQQKEIEELRSLSKQMYKQGRFDEKMDEINQEISGFSEEDSFTLKMK